MLKRRPDPELEQIRDQEAAKEKLLRKGLPIPRRPKGDFPEIHVDDEYGEWTDEQVIAEMQIFTRWADYLTVQLPLAEAAESTADRVHRRIRDLKTLSQDAPKGQVTLAKMSVALSEEVVEAEDVAAQAKAYRKLVAGLLENVTRDASLLSRELTRRVGRDSFERRERRWGGA